MNVLSLFDGISCGQLALNQANIEYDNYFASEIDKHAIAVTQHNFPNTIQLGDVRNIDIKNLPKIDLILAGSPCQGFSYAGKQLNFNDERSKLFFEFLKIKKQLNPTWFLLENVKMKKCFVDIIDSLLNEKNIKINSNLVSAQNRDRLYWTNIKYGEFQNKNIFLRDIVGQYDGIWVYPRGYNKGGVQSYNDKSPTITTSSWQYNFYIYRNGMRHKFTREICEQLQTIPKGYTSKVSENVAIKLIGNAWTVDVVAHILKGIKNDG